MGEDRGEVPGRETPQHRAPQGDLPAVLEHPHLARVLRLVRRCRFLERDGVRLVDRPPARLDHPVREREIVAPARIDLDVVSAPERVDRSVPAGDRAEPRLLLAQPELVAPVEPLAVRARCILETKASADIGDVGIGEVGDEPAERVGRPGRVRVRERDDLGRRLANRAILRRDLAAAWAVEQPDPLLAMRRRPRRARSCGRSMRRTRPRSRAGRRGSRARAGSRGVARSRPPRCTPRRSRSPRAPRRDPSRPAARGRVRGPPPRADSRRASTQARRATPRRASWQPARRECSPGSGYPLARHERAPERPPDPCSARDRAPQRGRPGAPRHVPRTGTRGAGVRDDARRRRRRER